jgi:hypothetical protein
MGILVCAAPIFLFARLYQLQKAGSLFGNAITRQVYGVFVETYTPKRYYWSLPLSLPSPLACPFVADFVRCCAVLCCRDCFVLARRLLVVALIAAANLADRDILFTYLVIMRAFCFTQAHTITSLFFGGPLSRLLLCVCVCVCVYVCVCVVVQCLCNIVFMTIHLYVRPFLEFYDNVAEAVGEFTLCIVTLFLIATPPQVPLSYAVGLSSLCFVVSLIFLLRIIFERYERVLADKRASIAKRDSTLTLQTPKGGASLKLSTADPRTPTSGQALVAEPSPPSSADQPTAASAAVDHADVELTMPPPPPLASASETPAE